MLYQATRRLLLFKINELTAPIVLSFYNESIFEGADVIRWANFQVESGVPSSALCALCGVIDDTKESVKILLEEVVAESGQQPAGQGLTYETCIEIIAEGIVNNQIPPIHGAIAIEELIRFLPKELPSYFYQGIKGNLVQLRESHDLNPSAERELKNRIIDTATRYLSERKYK